MIDEASRERFIYPFKEHSSYSTIDFVKRSIVYFGYKPNIIQTDDGQEFTHIKKTNRIHPFYNYLSFYSYDDLLKQMKAYLKRSSNIPMQVLCWIKKKKKRNQIKSNIQ